MGYSQRLIRTQTQRYAQQRRYRKRRMKHTHDPREVIKYITEHPEVGRTKIAKMFGINEQRAREYKRVALMSAEERGVDLKDAAQEFKDMLAEKGLTLDQIKEILTPRNDKIINIGVNGAREFAIGIVSDTHLCDKACAVSELHDIYSRFDKAGVSAVLHAGDIVAGDDVYKGQYVDLTHYGYGDQLSYLIKSYPKMKNNIKTYLISGNHDLSFKVKNGAHITSALADKRHDIVFCGDYDARVDIGGIKIGMHHGDGGGSYALSYKLQKAIELIGGGQKPQIYILGHYHTAMYAMIRNVHCFLPGCFQRPNDFSVRKNLPNQISGWVIYLQVEDDDCNTIRKINMENICYY